MTTTAPTSSTKKNGATPHVAGVVVQEIAVDRIKPSPFNRTRLGDLEELAQSFAERGIMSPLRVRPIADGMFELIFGERRWRAAVLAGLATVPCIVCDWNDQEVMEAQLVENLQRKDLHQLEEAESYERLMRDHGHTVETLVAKTGKSESTIRARLRLLDLAPVPRKAFLDDRIPPSIALLIARLGDPKAQDEVLETYFKGRVLDWDDKNPGKEIIEPLSYRELLRRIQSHYMLRLDVAPFAKDDAELVPEAGACNVCPHRTGNQRELLAETKSKDLCLKASCFEKKKAAEWDRRAADAMRAGLRVLGDKENLKVFPTPSSTKISFDSPWVDLEDELPLDLADRSGKKTWKALLGKNAPAPIVLARDGTGAPRPLIDRKAAIDRATEAGKLDERTAKGAAPTKAKDFDHGAQQKKEAEKYAARRGAVVAALEKIAAAASKPLAEGKAAFAFWKLLLVLIYPSLTLEDVKSVAKRRGLVGEDTKGKTPVQIVDDAMLKACETLKADDLRGLVVELLAADRAAFLHNPDYGKKLKVAADHFKVDLKELETKAAADIKAKAAKAADKKPAKKPAAAKGGAK